MLAEHISEKKHSRGDPGANGPSPVDGWGRDSQPAGTAEAPIIDAINLAPPQVETRTSPPQIGHSKQPKPALSPRHGARRFLTLRVIAAILLIGGAAAGAISFVIGLLPLLAAISINADAGEWTAAFILTLVNWSWGAAVAIAGILLSYLIQLGLQIEANIFESKESLRRLENRPDQVLPHHPIPRTTEEVIDM